MKLIDILCISNSYTVKSTLHHFLSIGHSIGMLCPVMSVEVGTGRECSIAVLVLA